MKQLIAPSILSANLLNLKEDLTKIETSADLVHIDVMDGNFVPPISFGETMVDHVKKGTSLYREVHLMIKNPASHIDSFARAGSQRIIFHLETDNHSVRTLSAIKDLGISSGIAVNPSTSVSSTYDFLHLCDVLLIMTVNPGWGGQKFLDFTLYKVKEAAAEIRKRKLSTLIEVDGGINDQTAKQCIEAGASILVAGNYVFNYSNPAERIKLLKGL